MADAPYTRPSLDAEERAEDLALNAGAASVGNLDRVPAITSTDDVTDYFGADVESIVNDPYPGRSDRMNRGVSLLGLAHVGRFLMSYRPGRATESIDETSPDGWRWTGQYTYSETALDSNMRLVGEKSGVGTVNVTASIVSSLASIDVKLDVTGSFTDADGKRILLTEKGVIGGSLSGISFSLKHYLTRDNLVTASAEIIGTGSLPDIGSNFVLNASGRESVVSEDGYWVNLVYSNWTIEFIGDPLTEDLEGLDVLASGVVTMVASDGYTGRLQLSDDLWNGWIKDKSGTTLAVITGNADEWFWTIDLVEGGSLEVGHDYFGFAMPEDE